MRSWADVLAAAGLTPAGCQPTGLSRLAARAGLIRAAGWTRLRTVTCPAGGLSVLPGWQARQGSAALRLGGLARHGLDLVARAGTVSRRPPGPAIAPHARNHLHPALVPGAWPGGPGLAPVSRNAAPPPPGPSRCSGEASRSLGFADRPRVLVSAESWSRRSGDRSPRLVSSEASGPAAAQVSRGFAIRVPARDLLRLRPGRRRCRGRPGRPGPRRGRWGFAPAVRLWSACRCRQPSPGPGPAAWSPGAAASSAGPACSPRSLTGSACAGITTHFALRPAAVLLGPSRRRRAGRSVVSRGSAAARWPGSRWWAGPLGGWDGRAPGFEPGRAGEFLLDAAPYLFGRPSPWSASAGGGRR